MREKHTDFVFNTAHCVCILQMTPKGSVLAFCQADLVGPKDQRALPRDGGVGASAGDGRGGWTDIALRRSTDGGAS